MNRFAFTAAATFLALLMISSTVFIFKECGAQAFLFGNGAFYAAISGACEEK